MVDKTLKAQEKEMNHMIHTLKMAHRLNTCFYYKLQLDMRLFKSCYKHIKYILCMRCVGNQNDLRTYMNLKWVKCMVIYR